MFVGKLTLHCEYLSCFAFFFLIQKFVICNKNSWRYPSSNCFYCATLDKHKIDHQQREYLRTNNNTRLKSESIFRTGRLTSERSCLAAPSRRRCEIKHGDAVFKSCPVNGRQPETSLANATNLLRHFHRGASHSKLVISSLDGATHGKLRLIRSSSYSGQVTPQCVDEVH